MSDQQQPTVYQQVVDKVSQMSVQFKELSALLKSLNKEIAKSSSKKAAGKRVSKAASGDRPLSGFAKPTRLSSELCDFLKVGKDEMLARTDVTRRLNAYFKEHNLQNPDNKKEIKPDAAIKKLLNLKDGDVLTYFNLQRHMKHLFVSSSA